MAKDYNVPELKKAIYTAAGTLLLGTVLAFELVCSPTMNSRTSTTKRYSPLSYLELTAENGSAKRVSQKSLLTKNVILEFYLNSYGEVEKMVEDSSLWGKSNMRISLPEENKTVNWGGVNQTAQRYIAFFQEKQN